MVFLKNEVIIYYLNNSNARKCDVLYLMHVRVTENFKVASVIMGKKLLSSFKQMFLTIGNHNSSEQSSYVKVLSFY